MIFGHSLSEKKCIQISNVCLYYQKGFYYKYRKRKSVRKGQTLNSKQIFFFCQSLGFNSNSQLM